MDWEEMMRVNEDFNELRGWFLRSRIRSQTFLTFKEIPLLSGKMIEEIMGKMETDRNIYKYLKEFEEKGFIQISQKDSPDKREKVYELTEKGNSFLDFIIKEGWDISDKIQNLNELIGEFKDFKINGFFDKINLLKENLEGFDLKDLKTMLQKLEIIKKIGDLTNAP